MIKSSSHPNIKVNGPIRGAPSPTCFTRLGWMWLPSNEIEELESGGNTAVFISIHLCGKRREMTRQQPQRRARPFKLLKISMDHTITTLSMHLHMRCLRDGGGVGYLYIWQLLHRGCYVVCSSSYSRRSYSLPCLKRGVVSKREWFSRGSHAHGNKDTTKSPGLPFRSLISSNMEG